MKLLIAGDLQCGHIMGITPPKYQGIIANLYSEYPKLTQITKTMWDFVEDFIKDKKYDAAIINAEGIEGKNTRGGARELITPDRIKQLDIFAEVLQYIDAPNIYMTVGSAYHSGRSELWEKLMEKIYPQKIIVRNVLDLNINGIKFRCRHKIGRTSTPTGGDIMLRKKWLESLIWHVKHDFDMPQVLIFSHAHYFRYLGEQDWLAMILPSLQGFTEYGALESSGHVDFGLVEFDVPTSNFDDLTFNKKLLKMNLIYPYETIKVKERKDK